MTRKKAAYGQRASLGTRVHALHVHVRTEHGHASGGVAVSLETLEELLGVVEDGGTGVDVERAVCWVWGVVSGGGEMARTVWEGYKPSYMAGSWGCPILLLLSMGW